MTDVVVVGAGIVGMLSALALRDRGLEVTLVDAGRHLPSASWAGGGILSPLFPWRYSDAVNRLCADAVPSYQGLAERITAAGGPDPEVSIIGMIACSDDSPDTISQWCLRFALDVEKVRANEVEDFLPGSPAWWFPRIANVRNSKLLTGLHALLQKENVVCRRDVVERLEPRGDGITIRTRTDSFQARRVLLAAGAWSPRLLASFGVSLDVQPVKGQMLLFDEPKLAPASMILTEQGYIIPRRDGHILVGSTLEPKPENMLPTREACLALHDVAARILPALGNRTPVAQWAGFRPGTARAAPIIDQVDDRVWLATGHYRNGLVSGPASATLVAQLMCDEPTTLDPRPYSLSS